MGDVHVRALGEVWALEVGGHKHWSFDTQDEAVQRGRCLAEQEDGELVIHGKHGATPREGQPRAGSRSNPAS